MPPLPRARHALWPLLAAAVLSVAAGPRPARADGLIEALNASEEVSYSLISSKTRDASGTTTRIETATYGARSHMRLNYNLLPTLNLNAGSTYDKNLSTLSGDADDTTTELTRFRPYAWLTLRDPIVTAAIGYDVSDDTVQTWGQEATSLIRDTYSASVTWRPSGLPTTQARYTGTSTRDGTRTVLDTAQEQLSLKSEYLAGGFNGYYAGSVVDTTDHIREAEARQVTHEGKLAYTTTVLDGRLSVATDNRLRFTELTTERAATGLAGLGTAVALSLPAAAGLSALDETPVDGALGPNAALIDGDATTSAGLNIGFPGGGGDFTRRNAGLDFGTAVAVNRVQVWVDGFGPGPLPADITGFFTWDVYTSADNLSWALHATIPGATFGPFDRRFQIDVPAVTTRYLKVVTRPLPGGTVGATNSSLYPTIFITEVQAFADRTAQGAPGGGRQRITQTVRTHTLDVKVVLFRSPSLYYRFGGDYQEFEPEGEPRYNVSNGLYVSHRFTRVLAAAANASLDLGSERDEARTGVLYHASITATPLRTLTDGLVVSGNRQWTGETTTRTDSVVLHNTAQLYRGLDATLNLGAAWTAEERGDATSSERRDLYVNAGTGITPHPSLTATAYYLGKLSRSATEGSGEAVNVTENRGDLGVSFTPFRTLALSASASIVSQTDHETTVIQSYGVSWAPFPDGNLQFSVYYGENRLPDDARSRIIQPGVRWYLTGKRRSYVEASYQLNTSSASAVRTESQTVSARLNLVY